MTLVVIGPPRTKKNSLRVMRGKGGRPFVAQSREACAWEEIAILQLQAQRARFDARSPVPLPWVVPANLRALVYRDRAVGDLGNYLAAVCDALERAGIVANDRLVAGFDGSRLLVDRKNPRVEIELTEMAG